MLREHPRIYVSQLQWNVVLPHYARVLNTSWVKHKTAAGVRCTQVVYCGQKAAPRDVQRRYRQQVRSALRANRRPPPRRLQPAAINLRAPIDLLVGVARGAVAALASAVQAPAAPAAAAAAPAFEKPAATAPTCVVCLDQTVKCNVALWPCMHMCVCQKCGPAVNERCPLCRARSSKQFVVYY